MQNAKTIFVTGATGNQGGAVARALIERGFGVKALTRHPRADRAQSLQAMNAELVEGDLNEIDTFRRALPGVDGIFSVQSFESGIKKEIRQGVDLANLAKEYGIKHVVYSSVSGADLRTGIPHWESKFEIENHIKSLGLPYTIVRPTSLYENFLIPQVRKRLLKGKLVSPLDQDKVQQLVSSRDVGSISAAAFLDPDWYLGKTLTLAAEQMTTQQVADTFAEVLGKKVTYQKLPGLITTLAMGRNLYRMFRWINENDARFVKDLPAFRAEYPNLMGLKEWIRHDFKLTG